MSQDEMTLVCEGQPRGRDVRWLGLVMGQLSETLDIAGKVRVVPAGSKADLGAAVRGLRESLRTARIYGIRDRDFLRRDLVAGQRAGDVYPLDRHCLESYLIEPSVVEAALGARDVATIVEQLAAARFWRDVARAVADDISYRCREVFRLSMSAPAEAIGSAEQAAAHISAAIQPLPARITAAMPDVSALVQSFAEDMRSAPIWTRVDGCELMNGLERELRRSVLAGGDIEGRLFRWCSENSPPLPLLEAVKQALLSRAAPPQRPAPAA